MKINTPLLLKMRAVISDDGRLSRFFLVFKSGQHAAFTVACSKIGLLIEAIKRCAQTMRERLSRNEANSLAEVTTGLSDAVTITSVASGSDANTGEKLLWLETADSGSFAFRLSPEAAHMIADAVGEHEDALEEPSQRRVGSGR